MQRQIECDVAVLGGGAAGVAAAIGASRAGAKTVLIERNPYFGGQATNSQVTAYCGFFTRGENYDQVVEGVGGEVLKRLEKYGTNIHRRPSKSTGNVSVSFNPEYVKLVMDQILQESSVEYYLHSQMYEVLNNNGTIEEIKCTDDEGTFTVRAKAFVDASGNANLVHFAEIKTNWGDEDGNVQQSSLPFRIDNMPAKEILKSDIEVALKKAKEAGIPIHKETGLIVKIPDKTYGYCTIPSTVLSDLSAETLTKLFTWIDGFGTAMPPLIGIILLSIFKYQKQSLINLNDAMVKGVSWPSIIMVSATLVLGSAMTNSQIGLTTFLSSSIQPITTGLSSIALILLFALWAGLQSNVSSHMVTAQLVPTIAVPAALASGSISAAAITAVIGLIASTGSAAPPSMPYVAVAGSSGWTNSSVLLRYGFLMMVVIILVASFIGYPIANAIMG